MALISPSFWTLGVHRIFTSPVDGRAVSTQSFLLDTGSSPAQLTVAPFRLLYLSGALTRRAEATYIWVLPKILSEERMIHGCNHFLMSNCGYWRENQGHFASKMARKDSSKLLGDSFDKLTECLCFQVCCRQLSGNPGNDPFNLQA